MYVQGRSGLERGMRRLGGLVCMSCSSSRVGRGRSGRREYRRVGIRCEGLRRIEMNELANIEKLARYLTLIWVRAYCTLIFFPRFCDLDCMHELGCALRFLG